MYLKLQISDALGELYQAEAEARNKPISTILEERLAQAAGLDPRNRPVIISGPVREQLERLTGKNPILTEVDLLQRIHRLAKIHFGVHELQLTPGQLEEIAHMAKKRGRPQDPEEVTIDKILQEAWTAFTDDFFHRLPALPPKRPAPLGLQNTPEEERV